MIASRFLEHWPPIVALLLTGAAVAVCFKVSCDIAEADARQRFDAKCDETISDIASTFKNYASKLVVGRAFIDSAGSPSRKSWNQFTSSAGFDTTCEGIYGYAFVAHVAREDLASFINEQRLEGFEDFRIKYHADADADLLARNDSLYVIKYHEPESVNRHAIGLDLSSRSRNKLVYESAAYSGEATLSDAIILAQEDESRRGLVMALPVYRDRLPPKDPSKRLENTIGWVAVPIGMKELFNSKGTYESDLLALKVYEDSYNGYELYNSSGFEDKYISGFYNNRILTVGGKKIAVSIVPQSAHAFAPDLVPASFFLFGGSLVVVLVTCLVHVVNKRRNSLETRLGLATRNANIGLWEWNLTRNTLRFSDSYYEMLGYSPEEIAVHGDSWDSFCHPDDLESELEALDRHFKGETPIYANEHRVRTKDGSWLWVKDVGEVVKRASDGTPKLMLGIHLDIQSLREATEHAHAANNLKSEFLANMSHEIRTPLTAILGYIDLIDRGEIEPTDAALTIRSNADMLLTIVNDVLDVSKLESGQLAIECVACNPIAITQEVLKLLSIRSKDKGLDIELGFDTPIPEQIETDPSRLRQILINLIGNAIKFTHEGHIAVRLAHNTEEKLLHFRVIDTGVGMTEEQLELIRAFNPFVQADSSTARQYGGSGLGLRISSKLTALLGGELKIKSMIGEGSVFEATISTGDARSTLLSEQPDIAHVSSTNPDPKSNQPVTPTKRLENARILVVEDGADNQALIQHHLSREHAECYHAHNGEECIEMITGDDSNVNPDLILMDIHMPGLDGYETTRRLRDSGIRCPIIALTAHAGIHHRRLCIDVGCDEFLTKPIDFDELISICESYTKPTNKEASAA